MRGGTRKIRDIKSLSQATAGASSGAGDVIQMEEMGTSGFLFKFMFFFLSLLFFSSSLIDMVLFCSILFFYVSCFSSFVHAPFL